ncbi:hypothetical protein LYNGBM3L_46150 [Moorena producens 3L]|uniref:Uncharacterized protein n=1 Tax=Moorena producens 3L TaxID=489825 RepID=F4XWW0_9CYAN|nr:hypothetical protein LYNGBM3L_46150 [Moorena producens 3L]
MVAIALVVGGVNHLDGDTSNCVFGNCVFAKIAGNIMTVIPDFKSTRILLNHQT